MLRIGHKFAFKGNLRHSLSRLVKETDDRLGKRINNCSKLEKSRWHQWKLDTIREIVNIKDTPDHIESAVYRGIQHLKELDVILKQADKNLGLVPIRGDIYNAMVREWLQEPSFSVVTSMPHKKILSDVISLVYGNEAVAPRLQWLMISTAKKHTDPCPFYIIPKIHKRKIGSRPITAQHSYVLSGVSTALAEVLNSHVEAEKTIGIDSKTTVKRLESLALPDEFVFLTYDVEACYPSIDLEDAFKTFETCMPYWSQVGNGVWLNLLKLVMRNNYVTANGKIYVQKVGTATGTQVAPPFANLYLYYKFFTVLQDEAILFQERFIDDGLLIVRSKLDAERIMEGLLHASSLNLTWEISNSHAIYLDLHVFKGRRLMLDNKLDLKVYFKPTNKLLYLPAKSNHPLPMKTGIIRGEAIRTLRNTSDKSDWLKALRHIFKGLMARGYDPKEIKKKWKTVRFEDRDKYINFETKKQRPRGLLVKTSFHPKTKQWWKYFIAKRPLEDVLKRRRMNWNKAQAEILSIWPPKIIWCDFRKIAHHTISSREIWKYRPKRSREESTILLEKRKRSKTAF